MINSICQFTTSMAQIMKFRPFYKHPEKPYRLSMSLVVYDIICVYQKVFLYDRFSD